MSINSGLFTSKKDDWATPQDFFDWLNKKFAFQLDVAADDTNHKCERYFTRENSALHQDWADRNWMNPPYGKEIAAFIAKADYEAEKGRLTVGLLPARVDTAWYHEHCSRWHTVFLRGRLKFDGPSENSAPFPSMLVFFGIPAR